MSGDSTAYEAAPTEPRGRRCRPGWIGWLALVSGLAVITRGAEKGGSAEESDPGAWPRYELRAERHWFLAEPRGQRLDASGLLRRAEGEWLTVNDQNSQLYRLVFREGTNVVDLVRVSEFLTPKQTAPWAAEKFKRYDLEGLGEDDQGRVYVCEEGNRWILRWDPKADTLERLNIDWKPVRRWFSGSDPNASFEGVAVGGDRLYVANERQMGRIIVVDLNSLEVIDDFQAAPAGNKASDVHYTDLCWADGTLWVLLRDLRKVLQVDPGARRVMAEFDYSAMEMAPEVIYALPIYAGFMEGLSVDREFIWLLIDNNGMGRRADRKDTRPILFRCRRPASAAGSAP